MCERDIDRLPLTRPQPRDLAPNPGMGINQRPFGLHAGAESHQARAKGYFPQALPPS